MSTILVVDDLPAIRVPVATVLQGEGHKVLQASNGVEALAAVRQQVPDLILLDLLMPEMGGLEFLRHLRSMPAARHVPVILLSAAEGEKDVLKAAQYGVHGYLLKAHLPLKQLLARVAKDLAPRRSPKAA